VDVHQTRRHVEAPDVHDLLSICFSKARGDPGNPAEAIATSITPSMLLPGSMTWPPFSSRS